MCDIMLLSGKGVSITITASNKSAFVLSAEMHVAENEEKNKRGDN